MKYYPIGRRLKFADMIELVKTCRAISIFSGSYFIVDKSLYVEYDS